MDWNISIITAGRDKRGEVDDISIHKVIYTKKIILLSMINLANIFFKQFFISSVVNIDDLKVF